MAENDELKQKLQDALKRANSPEGAENIISLLFPKARRALGNYVWSESTEYADRQRLRRISQQDFVSTYFRLDPQPATWSIEEVNEFLDTGEPEIAIAAAIKKISSVSKEGRRLKRLFLQSLDGAFGGQRTFSSKWLKALVAASPFFLKGDDRADRDFLEADSFDLLNRALARALKELAPEDRFALVSDAINGAIDISWLSDFVRMQLGDTNPEGAKSDRDKSYFGDHGDEIARRLLDRARSLATSGEFWSQANPGRILWFWWGRDLQEEVVAFTDEAQKNEQGVRKLLEISVSLVRSSAGNYEHVSRRQWSKIIDLESLTERAKELLTSSASETDRTLAKRFLDALQKGDEDRFK